MPSKSKKQHNFMTAIAHSPEFAKKAGVPQSVGKDFTEADKGRKFGTGGNVNYTYGGKGQINKQRTRGGSIDGYQKNIPNINLNNYEGKKSGGTIAMRKGGSVNPTEQGINKQQTHHGKMQMPNVSLNKYVYKKEGGMATSKVKSLFKGKETMKEELAEAKAIKSGKITPMEYAKGEKMEGHAKGGRISSKGEHSVQKQSKRGAEMVKMAKGGLAGGHKSADGIAIRGKTRAMAPSMCGGGMAKGKK